MAVWGRDTEENPRQTKVHSPAPLHLGTVIPRRFAISLWGVCVCACASGRRRARTRNQNRFRRCGAAPLPILPESPSEPANGNLHLQRTALTDKRGAEGTEALPWSLWAQRYILNEMRLSELLNIFHVPNGLVIITTILTKFSFPSRCFFYGQDCSQSNLT